MIVIAGIGYVCYGNKMGEKMKKNIVKRVCMVMMTGVMLAGCGKSTDKPAEQNAPVEAQVEESADEAESKEASDGAGAVSTETTSESDFELGSVGDVIGIVKYTGSAESVVIPDTIDGVTITAIGNAFNGNDTIKSVVLPDTVEVIGEATFMSCYSLESVKMSGNITEIGENAFFMCDSLKEIVLPEGIRIIGEQAFLGSGIETLILPTTLEEVGKNALGDIKIQSIVIPANIKNLVSTFNGCKQLREATLNEGIEIIGEDCFRGCDVLEKVVIPSTVCEIDKDAFAYDTLDNITIITTAGSYAETYANENGIPCEIQ